MNILTRFLTYRALREGTRDASSARKLTDGIVAGFALVVGGLLLLGALVRLLS